MKRGFYQQYSYEVKPNCFGEESEVLMYKIYEIIAYEVWFRLYELPGIFYDLYLIVDKDCQLEENVYDLVVICDTHICTLERIIQNEVSAIFQVTGVVNSILAVYYMDVEGIPDQYLHDVYFDAWSDVGTTLGKLLRYSFRFDPKKGDYDDYEFEEEE